jgi:hypothetical protein
LVRNNCINLDFIAFRAQYFCFVICIFCHPSNSLFLKRISSWLLINPELRSKTYRKKASEMTSIKPIKMLMEMIKNMILKLENLKVLARQQHLHIKTNFTE